MSNIEAFKERPDIQQQMQRKEVGDVDGTYEQITEDPGMGNKTVYVSKSQNTKTVKSAKKSSKENIDQHNIFTAS